MVRAIRRMRAPPCQCHSRLRVCGWSPAESPRPFGRSAGYHSVPCGCAPLHPQGNLRVPCGYPADRPKGRGQPRRSCGRRRFCGALLSLDTPSWQRWLACACIWRACRTRDPHLVTPTKAVETPYSHPQSSGRLARTQRFRKSRRVAMQRRGAARAHSNSRRRQRRSRSGRRRIVSPSVAAAHASRRYAHTDAGWRVQPAPGL